MDHGASRRLPRRTAVRQRRTRIGSARRASDHTARAPVIAGTAAAPVLLWTAILAERHPAWSPTAVAIAHDGARLLCAARTGAPASASSRSWRAAPIIRRATALVAHLSAHSHVPAVTAEIRGNCARRRQDGLRRECGPSGCASGRSGEKNPGAREEPPPRNPSTHA